MSDLNEKFEKFNDTPDTTNEFEPEDIEKNKLMAVFAYLSWLVIIPIIAAKDSKFAKFHANQGLVLAISEVIIGIVMGVLRDIPVVGFIFSLVGGAVSVVCFVLTILGLVNAATGKAKELPIIGKIRIIK